MFEKFMPGEIMPEGVIGMRIRAAADNILNHLDVRHTFVEPFLKPEDEPRVPGGFVGLGMLFDAVVKAAVSGAGGERMMKLVRQLSCWAVEMQRPDGSISIFNSGTGYWDSHEQAYLIQGLTRCHRFFRDGAALETAGRLADFLIRRQVKPTLGIEEAFLLLFEETGERRYLDFMEKQFRIRDPLTVYDSLVEVNGIRHVYTFLARLHAQMRYERTTGRSIPGLAGDLAWFVRRIVEEGYMDIIGTCSGGDYWGEIWDNTHNGTGRRGETCATAYFLRTILELQLREERGLHADLYERAMLNAFLAAQSGDGRKLRYFTTFNQKTEWYEFDTYCCPNNFRRMVFELPQSIFLRAGDEVVVNQYVPARLETRIGGVRFELRGEGGLPDGEKAVYRISVDGSGPAPSLRFRVPGWCREFTVTDEKHTVRGKPGEYVRIGSVHDGMCLTVSLPQPLRLIEGKAAQTGRCALMRGPVVYGMPWPPEDISEQEAVNLVLEPEGVRYCGERVNGVCSFGWSRAGCGKFSLVPFYSGCVGLTYFHSRRDDVVQDELFQR